MSETPDKWAALAAIMTPEKWEKMYQHYQHLLTVEDMAAWYADEFSICNKHRAEILEENERLKKENFGLAAHRCHSPSGDQWGNMVCLDVKALREENKKLRELLEKHGIKP